MRSSIQGIGTRTASVRRPLSQVDGRPAVLVQFLWIDGLPGYVSLERDGVPQTTALEIEDGRIARITLPATQTSSTGWAAW